MIDFGKLYCDLHPNEIITNFCLKQTCMVGLCATCICTHTQYHVNNKTTPEFQNIRNTFSSMHQTIRKKINSLETQKNRIEKITQFIQTKRKALKQNIEQTRKQAIAVVNNFYDNKQKCMLREMQSEEKKMGLHSQQRMQSLLNSLVRQTSSLLGSAQQLNSHNFLQSYQRIKTQTLQNATKLQDEISRQLDRNENFETIINTNDEYINNIMRVLEQSLHLTFKINHRQTTLKDQSPLIVNQSTSVFPQRRSVQLYPQIIHENSNQPNFIQKPQIQSNFFSALSFSNMPQMSKQETAKFTHNQSESGTTKSIALPQSQKTSAVQSGRQNKSVIYELTQSKAAKQGLGQNQLFKQKDFNARPQSLMKSSAIINRNHQSQIIINQKPFGYQSSGGWYNPRQNNHQQSLNQSLIENVQHFSQEKQKHNTVSQFNVKNQSAVNLNQIGRQPQMNFQSGQKGHKLNFVPQIYDTSQFNRNAQSQVQLSDSKKMKKSGLTLLKTNHSSLREKSQGQ